MAAPAEGKTFSFLHYVRHVINKDDSGNTEAVIYCPTDMIAAQYKLKLTLFDCADKVLISSNWQPKKWLENDKNKIFVVDEGEDAIEKMLIDVTPQGFQGLMALREKKTVLFSATLTDYFRACWRAAF